MMYATFLNNGVIGLSRCKNSKAHIEVECASTALQARLNLEGQSYSWEMDARPGAKSHAPQYPSPTLQEHGIH